MIYCDVYRTFESERVTTFGATLPVPANREENIELSKFGTGFLGVRGAFDDAKKLQAKALQIVLCNSAY